MQINIKLIKSELSSKIYRRAVITLTAKMSGPYGNCRGGLGGTGSGRGRGSYTPSTSHIKNTV